MTFEQELNAMRLVYTTLSAFPRERRDYVLRQVTDALNREQARPRPLRVVEHVELAPPPDAA